MISDGKNILLTNNETMMLLLLLRYIDENLFQYFEPSYEEDMIVRAWGQRWQVALIKTKENPFEKIDV